MQRPRIINSRDATARPQCETWCAPGRSQQAIEGHRARCIVAMASRSEPATKAHERTFVPRAPGSTPADRKWISRVFDNRDRGTGTCETLSARGNTHAELPTYRRRLVATHDVSVCVPLKVPDNATPVALYRTHNRWSIDEWMRVVLASPRMVLLNSLWRLRQLHKARVYQAQACGGDQLRL